MAGRQREAQRIESGEGHRQEERKMDGGHVTDINRRRRQELRRRKMMGECLFSLCKKKTKD